MIGRRVLGSLALLGCLGTGGITCKPLPPWGPAYGPPLWFAMEPFSVWTDCPAGQVAPLLAPNEIRWWTQHGWAGEPEPGHFAVAPDGQKPRTSVATYMWDGPFPLSRNSWANVELAVEYRDTLGRRWQRWDWEYGHYCPFGQTQCDPVWVSVEQAWGSSVAPKTTLQIHRANGCDQWVRGYITCIQAAADCDLPIWSHLVDSPEEE